jgi:hypothetical protein
MGVVGTLLKNRRAGEAHLAWNLPGLNGALLATVTGPVLARGRLTGTYQR